MPFQRGSATDHRNLLLKMDGFLKNQHIRTVAVNAGGTGYVVGDLLSVAGGTVVLTMTARLEVLAVSGGVITSVRIYDAGAYSTAPSLTANAVTGGTGSSATMDLTMTYQHVRDVAVNAGGTGYVVGDLLTVLGGTPVNSRPAVIEVTSVAAGVIDGVKMSDWGTYSANPSLTANAVTGGTGSSATMDLTMILGDWAQRIANVSSTVDVIEVGAVSIVAVGSGYSVSDVLTLDSTAGNTSQATFTVSGIDGGGGVTGLSLTTSGDYSGMQSGTIGTTGGGGTGCTVDPKFQPTRDEYLWEGAGSGTEQVYIGTRTAYSVAEDQVSWQLVGFTGWDGSSDWEAQSGISPGNSNIDPVVNSSRGSYTLLAETTINFWFRANQRAIIFIPDMSGNQQSGHIGLLDPYGTNVEIPYPMFVCGSSDLAAESIGSSSIYVRAIADPTALNASDNGGPGFFRTGSGVYEKVWNGVYDGNDIGANNTQAFFVYPTAEVQIAGLDTEDQIARPGSDDYPWDQSIPSNKAGNPSQRLKPSPDSGGDLYLPVPCVVIQSDGVGKHKAMGEINGLFWVSAEDGLASGDKFTAGSRVFRVFQMGANSLSYAHFCVEEN